MKRIYEHLPHDSAHCSSFSSPSLHLELAKRFEQHFPQLALAHGRLQLNSSTFLWQQSKQTVLCGCFLQYLLPNKILQHLVQRRLSDLLLHFPRIDFALQHITQRFLGHLGSHFSLCTILVQLNSHFSDDMVSKIEFFGEGLELIRLILEDSNLIVPFFFAEDSMIKELFFGNTLLIFSLCSWVARFIFTKC